MLIYVITALCVMLALDVAETRRQLMMLQQNSYRNERYRRWLRASGDDTTYYRIGGWAMVFFGISSLNIMVATVTVLLLMAVLKTRKLYSEKYKKPLVMTKRATRIFVVQLVIMAAIILFACIPAFNRSATDILYYMLVAGMGCYCVAPYITMLANTVLKPVEDHINRKFYNAAKSKLQSMPGLKIVGITGSYGKTSTKHYLQRILSEQYDTLMTPGSYNTTLGVVRTINEMLKPYNEVFIVEMGAKQKGDIKEICDLVNPGSGIITSVGPQHLETFKTIETVRDTKFELADAIPADGVVVINNDFDQSAARGVSNTRAIRYGIANAGKSAVTARNIKYSPRGTDFTYVGPDGEIDLHTSLVGECNIANLLGAITIALQMNVPVQKIKYAVERIDQVEHRLNMKTLPNGLTIIDDAFNSNPMGSRMALDVLAMMVQGRRIVITPGMIELGEKQYELNREFGRHMVGRADIAMIVGKYNSDAISAGVEEGIRENPGKTCDVMHFATFTEAYNFMMSVMKPGDTVLIENDLPDTFK